VTALWIILGSILLALAVGFAIVMIILTQTKV